MRQLSFQTYTKNEMQTITALNEDKCMLYIQLAIRTHSGQPGIPIAPETDDPMPGMEHFCSKCLKEYETFHL